MLKWKAPPGGLGIWLTARVARNFAEAIRAFNGLRPRRLSLSLSLCAALGCSASVDNSSQQALQSYAERYCDLANFCCDQVAIISSRKSCIRILVESIDATLLDANAGDACLAALKAAQTNVDYCRDDFAIPACEHVFRHGTSRPGEPCTSSDQCSGDNSYCTLTKGTDLTAPRACMTIAAGKAGDGPCVTDDTGTAGVYDTPDPFVSLAYSCTVAEGLYCANGTTPRTNRCTAFARVGEACESVASPLCAHGLACHDRFCRPLAVAGEACSPSPCALCPPVYTGTDGTCAEGLYCAYDGSKAFLCFALPIGGEPCPKGFCANGLSCQGGTCTPTLAPGASCAADPTCVGPAGKATRCALCASGFCGGGTCAVAVGKHAKVACSF